MISLQVAKALRERVGTGWKEMEHEGKHYIVLTGYGEGVVLQEKYSDNIETDIVVSSKDVLVVINVANPNFDMILTKTIKYLLDVRKNVK